MPVTRINTSRTNLFIAIIINAAILIVFLLFTKLQYETNDDYALSAAISQRGYPFFPFSNYFLNTFVAFVQKLTPFWNAWVGCQIVSSFISFVAITYVFFEKTKEGLWVRLLGICIVLVFAYDHYTMFQFTKTSALLMVAGSLLTIYALQYTVSKKILLIGGILLCLGAWYRFTGLYAALCFVAVYAIISVIQNRKQIRLLLKNEKQKWTQIAIIIAVLFVIFLTNQLSIKIDVSSNELQAYSDYNSARSRFMDYPMPGYKANEEFFKGLGISDIDYGLMQNWFLDNNTVASLENLRQINQLQESIQKESINFSTLILNFLHVTKTHLLGSDKYGINTRFLFLLGVLILATTRIKRYPQFAFLALAYFVLNLYLFSIERSLYRATYVIDLAAAVWCVYSIRPGDQRTFFSKKCNGEQKIRLAKLLASVVIILIVGLNIGGFLKQQTPGENVSYQTNSGILMQYINSHPDKVFVFYNTASSLYNFGQYYYLNPIKPLPYGFQDNVFGFGGWSMMSPYINDRMEQKNLSNVFGDIVDNKSVYVIDIDVDNIWMREQFFTEHYAPPNETIYYQRVDTIGGFPLWQVKTG